MSLPCFCQGEGVAVEQPPRQLEEWGTPRLSCMSASGMRMLMNNFKIIMWTLVCPAAFGWCFQVVERQAHLHWISLENLFNYRNVKWGFSLPCLLIKQSRQISVAWTWMVAMSARDWWKVNNGLLWHFCSSGQRHKNQCSRSPCPVYPEVWVCFIILKIASWLLARLNNFHA